ncbi:MAG: phage shock protein A [Paraglaciecola sp.]|jgi:phage shock protein A
MGLISRMSDIVQANINAILDKAEDPQKIIKLLVEEMEETLVEVRGVAAKTLAEKTQLQRQLTKFQLLGNSWQKKAQLAIDKGREDLARSALEEKHHVLKQFTAVQQELENVNEGISKLQVDSGKLQDKLTEARLKQKSLSIRQHSVAARLHARHKGQVDKMDAAIVKFEQYERRIDDLESQVDAYDLVGDTGSLESQLHTLEVEEKIAQELAQLRQKVV